MTKDEGLLRLLERGKKRGYILFSEFDELLPDPENDEVGPELDHLLAAFESAGVEIVTEPGLTQPQAFSDDLAVDPVQVYLREVGIVPQLTREREIELSKLLRTCGREAEKAEAQLVESNLWRVVAVAQRYADPCDLHVLDLIKEGNKGLLKAVQTFDCSHGYSFSTYATWCSRQAIMRAASGRSG